MKAERYVPAPSESIHTPPVRARAGSHTGQGPGKRALGRLVVALRAACWAGPRAALTRRGGWQLARTGWGRGRGLRQTSDIDRHWPVVHGRLGIRWGPLRRRRPTPPRRARSGRAALLALLRCRKGLPLIRRPVIPYRIDDPHPQMRQRTHGHRVTLARRPFLIIVLPRPGDQGQSNRARCTALAALLLSGCSYPQDTFRTELDAAVCDWNGDGSFTAGECDGTYDSSAACNEEFVWCNDGTNVDDWAQSIEVAPAFDQGLAPYGKANAVRLFSWEGWTQDDDYDHDDRGDDRRQDVPRLHRRRHRRDVVGRRPRRHQQLR